MADIGSSLREARMRERIDISEVEAQTKIRAKYLRAIENEEWDLLPGPIYAKSFLRTYSDYLGLDSRTLLDEFKRRYEGASEHEARPMGGRVAARERSRDRGRGRERVRAPSWAPIGIAIVAIVAILYVIGSNNSGSSNTPVQKPPVHRRHASHRSRPASTTQAALPASVSLRMVPTSAVYVCLVNGHGTKLINERTFRAGETVPTETARMLLLTLGNAGVQMKVNGKAVSVAPSPSAIRLLIRPPATVKRIPLAQRPTCP